MSGWFNFAQNPTMVGADCFKIIDLIWFDLPNNMINDEIILLIYQIKFVSFENYFCIFVSKIFADCLFCRILVFTKNIFGNNVGKSFLGSLYIQMASDIYIIIYIIYVYIYIYIYIYVGIYVSMYNFISIYIYIIYI